MNILIIIPARGGSRGIPRKNLRALNGKPLIYYSITNALKSKFKPEVYVSSDDDEILMFAGRFGAKKFKRNSRLSDDKTTLEPVIYNAFMEISSKNKKQYDLIITMQPTSPLLSTKSLDSAIQKFLDNEETDVMISVKEKRHLSWKQDGDNFIPNYKERLNRQQLEPIFEETGSFVICRPENLIKFKKRIAGKIDLYPLNKKEAIDIDDYDDWALCNFYLKRKKILFVLTGNSKNGLGHIYRALVLSYDILDHELVFLVDKDSALGYEKLNKFHFTSYIQKYDNILDDIKEINPDIIINDRLDTDKEYMQSLRKIVDKIINFEDLGSGAKYADLVINALYPEKEKLANHYFGYEYFCARDEFIISKEKEIKNVRNVLISFGGTDPNNLTLKVLNSIYEYCQQNKISITIILGLGYNNEEELARFKDITIHRNISNISDYFLNSDIIFTSAGRTVYEIACIGTPTIVIPQNKRETTHLFADKNTGFYKLPIAEKVSNEDILKAFLTLVNNIELRKEMNKKMLSFDLKKGKDKIISLIKNLIEKK